MGKITRERVLEVYKRLPAGFVVSTSRLAQLLECQEYQVRGAVSWLVLGGQLEDMGTIERVDIKSRKYFVKFYRYTGKDEIHRVPRDPEARKISQERRSSSNQAIERYLFGGCTCAR